MASYGRMEVRDPLVLKANGLSGEAAYVKPGSALSAQAILARQDAPHNTVRAWCLSGAFEVAVASWCGGNIGEQVARSRSFRAAPFRRACGGAAPNLGHYRLH